MNSIEIDVLCVNLEPTDLVTLGQNDEHGRVVLAAKSIKAGSKVIRESPVLVWQKNNWIEFLDNYQVLPDPLKMGVLDMYYFPLGCDILKPLWSVVSRSAGVVGMNENLAMKLVSISMANSHEYYGSNDELYREVASFMPQHGTEKCALFLYASKVSHSCYPNVTYTSKTNDGKMEYKAVREIKEGDMITFPYINNLWEDPTHLRRKKLQDSRSFLCKCSRCMGPDYLRLMKCKNCAEGLLVCTYSQDGSASWRCKTCTIIASKKGCEVREKYFDDIISQIDMKLMMLGLQSVSLDTVQSNVDRIEQELSPLHFLSLKARNQYVKICASKAYDIEGNIDMVPQHFRRNFITQLGDPKKLRRDAANSAIKVVQSIECIAAECLSCLRDLDNACHEAVYEAVMIMFHCSQDLIGCPANRWPPNAKLMVERYLPLMKIQFGAEDLDVRNIETKVLGDVSISELSESLQESLKVSEEIAAKELSPSGSVKKRGKKKGGGSSKKKKGRGRK